MNERARAAAVLGLLAIAAGVVAQSGGAGETDVPAKAVEGTPSAEKWDWVLLAAAEEYLAWPRLYDFAQFAPALCRAPILVDEESDLASALGPTMSRSADSETHGRKLYYLHQSDLEPWLIQRPEFKWLLDAILSTSGVDAVEILIPGARFGTVLVKESWEAIETSLAPGEGVGVIRENPVFDPVTRRAYITGEQRDLFMMLKLDPALPETDEGWIYAVVDPKKKKVRASGRLENCMGCHQGEGTRDRLFGPK